MLSALSLPADQTGADAYRYSGANRWNHADTDAFGHLPLWEQHEVGRMYVYDSTMTRLASSGQLGVNDLAAFSKSSCDGTNGRSRMLCFDFVLAGYWGWGVVGDFRAAKLYDAADPEAALLASTIKGWTSFYRNFTKPRPSGAAGVLLAEQIHVKRPDSRSISAMASVTADTSLPERALLTALNPTLETKSENLTVPLYCKRSCELSCFWGIGLRTLSLLTALSRLQMRGSSLATRCRWRTSLPGGRRRRAGW